MWEAVTSTAGHGLDIPEIPGARTRGEHASEMSGRSESDRNNLTVLHTCTKTLQKILHATSTASGETEQQNAVKRWKISNWRLLQKNIIVFFFENKISKWRSFEKRAIFDLRYFSHLWCDQAKSVWSRSNSVFIFLSNWMHHFYSYIVQKNPLKFVQLVPKIWAVEGCQNKRKQKDIFCFVWLYLKIFPTSDWFCLIISHFLVTRGMVSIWFDSWCWFLFAPFWNNQLITKMVSKI